MADRPIILYRDTYEDFASTELTAIDRHFPGSTRNRVDVSPGDLVIARYCALPFYRELEEDLQILGAELVNTYSQHRYIADIASWYEDLRDLTPETWFRLQDVPDDGPFVVKGQTNSRKNQWNSMMFATTKREATETYLRLQDDGLIGSQNIYVRRYVPLVKLSDSVNGLPVSEEYRFFVLHGQILTGAFYWSSHSDELKDEGRYPDVRDVPEAFLRDVIDRIGDNAPAVVLDVARAADGRWLVVEINDLQMSGLSDNDADTLYRRMREVLDGRA